MRQGNEAVGMHCGREQCATEKRRSGYITDGFQGALSAKEMRRSGATVSRSILRQRKQSVSIFLDSSKSSPQFGPSAQNRVLLESEHIGCN